MPLACVPGAGQIAQLALSALQVAYNPLLSVPRRAWEGGRRLPQLVLFA
jgi:hypothetical protein